MRLLRWLKFWSSETTNQWRTRGFYRRVLKLGRWLTVTVTVDR